MKPWHETSAANFGLRATGMVCLGLGSLLAARLHQLALTGSLREAPTIPILLAALLFLCGSAGSALLFVGPGLWDRVEVSERWRRPSA